MMGLFEAIKAGDCAQVRALLDGGADVHGVGLEGLNAGRTPLELATDAGRLDVVGLLLDRGALVDVRNKYGLTPLMMATRAGRRELVQRLLDYGADANAVVIGGLKTKKTALMRAAQDGHLGIAQLLLDHGADIHARDIHGASALMHATWNHCIDVVRLLLDYGADANAQDRVGETPLMQAVHADSLTLVGLLLDHGADVHANDCQGNTALMIAARRGSRLLAERLIAHGADVDACNHSGYTPLMAAARGKHIAVAKVLLADGARWPDMRRLFSVGHWRSGVHALIELGYCPQRALVILNEEVPRLTSRRLTDFGYMLVIKHVEQGLPLPVGLHPQLQTIVDFFDSGAGLDAEDLALVVDVPAARRAQSVRLAVIPLIQVGLSLVFCNRVGCVSSLRLGWLDTLVARGRLPDVVSQPHRSLKRQARMGYRFFDRLLSERTGKALPGCADRITSFMALDASELNRLACVDASMGLFARGLPRSEPSGQRRTGRRMLGLGHPFPGR